MPNAATIAAPKATTDFPFAGFSWKDFINSPEGAEFAGTHPSRLSLEGSKTKYPEIEVSGQWYRVVKASDVVDEPGEISENAASWIRKVGKGDSGKKEYYFLLPAYPLATDWVGLIRNGINFLTISTERFNYTAKYFLKGTSAEGLIKAIEGGRLARYRQGVADNLNTYFSNIIGQDCTNYAQSDDDRSLLSNVAKADQAISQMFAIAFYDLNIKVTDDIKTNPRYKLKEKIEAEREQIATLSLQIEAAREDVHDSERPAVNIQNLEKKLEMHHIRLCAAENALLALNSLEIMIYSYKHYHLKQDLKEKESYIESIKKENEAIDTEIREREGKKGMPDRVDPNYTGVFLNSDVRNYRWIELEGELAKSSMPVYPLNKGTLRERTDDIPPSTMRAARLHWQENRIDKISACKRDVSRLEDIAKSMIGRIRFALENGAFCEDSQIEQKLDKALEAFQNYENAARRYISISTSQKSLSQAAHENLETAFNQLHDITKDIRETFYPLPLPEFPNNMDGVAAEAAVIMVTCRKFMDYMVHTKRNLESRYGNDRYNPVDAMESQCMRQLGELSGKTYGATPSLPVHG